MRLLLVVVALIATQARAGDDYLATLTATSGAATYTATAGASLNVLCSSKVFYAAGSASSPPTATTTTGAPLDFALSPKALPIRLSASQDRVSFIAAGAGAGFNCRIFTESVPPLTSNSLTSCLSIRHTVVSVGTSATAIPVSGQTGRRYIEICVSAENSGSPKVKCAVDPAANKPAFGLSEPGDVLQTGALPCVTYPVDSTHLVGCVADTVSTAVTTNECVSP